VLYGAAELVALEHEALLAGHERLERLPLLLIARLAPYRKPGRGGAPRGGPGQAVAAGGEGGGEERGGGNSRGHCVGRDEIERQLEVVYEACWAQLDGAAISVGFEVPRWGIEMDMGIGQEKRRRLRGRHGLQGPKWNGCVGPLTRGRRLIIRSATELPNKYIRSANTS
jgi:hypothetical protein